MSGQPLDTLELPFGVGSQRQLPNGTTLQLFLKDNTVVGRAQFGKASMGPPQHAHGGASFYVLDEAMGAAALLLGTPSVATHVDFELQRMVPLKEPLGIRAWIKSASSPIIDVDAKLTLQVCAELRDDKSNLLVRGTGIFSSLPTHHWRELCTGRPDWAHAIESFLTAAHSQPVKMPPRT